MPSLSDRRDHDLAGILQKMKLVIFTLIEATASELVTTYINIRVWVSNERDLQIEGASDRGSLRSLSFLKCSRPLSRYKLPGGGQTCLIGGTEKGRVAMQFL